jgi:hypothetical protein
MPWLGRLRPDGLEHAGGIGVLLYVDEFIEDSVIILRSASGSAMARTFLWPPVAPRTALTICLATARSPRQQV